MCKLSLISTILLIVSSGAILLVLLNAFKPKAKTPTQTKRVNLEKSSTDVEIQKMRNELERKKQNARRAATIGASSGIVGSDPVSTSFLYGSSNDSSPYDSSDSSSCDSSSSDSGGGCD